MDFKLWGGPYFGVLGCGSCIEPTPGPRGENKGNIKEKHPRILKKNRKNKIKTAGRPQREAPRRFYFIFSIFFQNPWIFFLDFSFIFLYFSLFFLYFLIFSYIRQGGAAWQLLDHIKGPEGPVVVVVVVLLLLYTTSNI